MKVIDIVKPEPKTKYEIEKRRENRWASELATMRAYRKRIKVVQL